MAKSESDQVTVDEAAAAENGAAPVEAVPSAGEPGAEGALGAPGSIRGVPIPAGAVIFGELTSAFVDGPRLLRFLGDRKHTGALADAGGGSTQGAGLHEGNVIPPVGARAGRR